MTMKEDEWRKSTFHHGVIGAEFMWPDALPVANQCYKYPLDLILSSATNKLLTSLPLRLL